MANLSPGPHAFNNGGKPRRRKRPSSRLVKSHRNYTVDDVANLLDVAKGTVRRWIKNGLPCIDDQRPLLILGNDLRDYLDSRKRARQECQLHECYCLKCKKPRSPALDMADFIVLTPTNGNLRALCPECSKLMYKRLSKVNLPAVQQLLTVTIMQPDERLRDCQQACSNDHLGKEAETHA